MIQDIYPNKLDNGFKSDAKPNESDSVFVFYKGDVLIKKGEASIIEFPHVSDFKQKEDLIYLFAIDDERYFLYHDCSENLEEYEFVNIKEVRSSQRSPKFRKFALMTANHLRDWYRDNVYCGRCGSRTVHSDTLRAKVCPDCGNMIFPKICPAVIVGIRNNNKLLLTKYRRGYGHNALVAGFTEIGETAEETVVREVMEETGLKVKNIRYYKSQPWGIADDLLLGFYCDVDGDDTITMDEEELKYAEWVERDLIELQPDDSSLTNEMMLQFKLGNQ